ncbi:MAG: SEL1-like repeat protein [Ruminococcus sp.]|nr:SEL1-like repeat protein [Ruminococcus sp.]
MQGARFILNTRYFSIVKPGEQTSEYKLSKEHVKKLVQYAGTRETVALELKPENANLTATLKQQETIDEMLKELQNGDENEGKETFEYKDYLKAPTRENASELISRLSEIILYGNNVKSINEVANLVDYAGNRPGVVRIGEHGLFSSFPNVDLDKAAEEISSHEGNIWTHILSLRREDADKLGYDSQAPWRNLVMSHIDDIAKAHDIKVENLRWYAAMHNTGHHPHIHLFVYSADHINNEGFFNEKKNKSISNLKSAFANDIFKDDPYFTYAKEQKTEYRNTLSKQSEKLLNELLYGENSGFSDDKVELLTNKMNELADLLPSKGKIKYGFLPAKQKALVNEIQKIFVYDNPILSQLYQNWCAEQNNIVKLYINEPEFDYPIESNTTFSMIKNDIINAAKGLRDGTSKNTDFEYVAKNNNTPQEKVVELDITKTTDIPLKQEPQEKTDESAIKKEFDVIRWGENYINHHYGFDKDYLPQGKQKYYTMNEMLKDYPELIYYSEDPKVYTPEHKNLNLIYKFDDEQIQKFKSLRILANNFDTRNSEICRKLADCYRYGNGCNKDMSEALLWYGIAVDEFEDSMSAYRLAELYYYGADGIEIDTNLSNYYFKTAYIQFRDEIKNSQYFNALENNSENLDYYDKVSREDAYKEYLIGRMYMNGHGIEQDYDKAYYSFKLSATNGYSHANYYIGNMYYYGLGFEQSFEKAAEYYYRAHENKDMYATYRLAKMYLKGEGVSVDLQKAEELLLKCSDRVVLANYDLARIYEENSNIFNVSDETIQKHYKTALDGLLEQEQDKHDPFTEMRIGSMYLNGKGTDKNIENAISWFDKAALSGNPDAAYQLAYIYTSKKYDVHDTEKATEYYKIAIEGYENAENDNENSTAEYRLGNMYLRSLGTEQNIDKAISWFSRSMQNGNADAAYRIAQIFSSEEYGFFDNEKSIIFYKYAADLGHAYANYYLGKQEFENNNIKASIDYFKRATDGNISHAWYKLGQIYSSEELGFFDGAKAQDCYANALKQYISDYTNNPDDFTAYRIASMYMHGQGTVVNIPDAISWFEKSYNFGNPDAAYQLGNIYHSDNYGFKNYNIAYQYYNFALNSYMAEFNKSPTDGNIAMRIGTMYHYGLGVERDIEKALSWYRKAVELGNLKAQEKIDNALNDKSLSAMSIAQTACHFGKIINTETQAAAKQHYASDHKLKRNEKLHKIAAGHAVSDNEQGFDY